MQCKTDQTPRTPSVFITDVNSHSRSVYAVVNPSVVSNVVRPTHPVKIFHKCFCAIWYLSHVLTLMENFYRDGPRGTPPSVGGKCNGGSQRWQFWTQTYIFRKCCKIGVKLVLITNRKLHMNF